MNTQIATLSMICLSHCYQLPSTGELGNCQIFSQVTRRLTMIHLESEQNPAFLPFSTPTLIYVLD